MSDPDADPTATTTSKRQFASDNYAGICPPAWKAMEEANRGHASAYGEDRWTERSAELLRDLFETDCEVFFTFNGTAANALAIASLCQPYHSVICCETAHVETDECGAPEFFTHGTKILLTPHEHGKLNLDEVDRLVTRRNDIHYPKPKALSITQATELGTVYSVDELGAVSELARRRDLRLHMDGARFANALETLDVAPKEVTWKLGIDVLCFGGTKNGLAVGDAVVFFDHDLAAEFDYRCKQAGQLASKMRFLSAPWVGLLENDVWRANARAANRAAARLEAALRDIPGIEIMFPRQANAVFVQLPESLREGLWERGWRFYTFIGAGGARLMCSWDTTDEDVDALTRDVRELAQAVLATSTPE
ncbi:Low specificity L-threonine aldolase [Planctomycetes bacterium Pan216]|uniref:L-threonine aldolase n=1 Tax=Kolteria novifilia TaxID=2527975 RepID=A0A518B3Y9_9BACT|nr:Low specificity L-threonine aldolase [Planctomycetes bacterium Pan216]